jgi:hypothetical protein
MPRKRDICDTDICTSEINDDLLCESDIPGTDDLSEELSAMMKGTSNGEGNEANLLRLIEEASNNLLTSDHNSDCSKVNTAKQRVTDVEGDMQHILKVVNGLNTQVKTLQKRNRTGSESSSRKRRSNVRECDPNDKRIRELEERVQVLCDKCDCISNDMTSKCSRTTLDDCEIDDKLYNFIHCQINERMDNIMDFINKKFDDVDDKLAAIRTSLGIIAGCR